MFRLKRILAVMVIISCLCAASGCNGVSNNKNESTYKMDKSDDTDLRADVIEICEGYGITYEDNEDRYIVGNDNLSLREVYRDEKDITDIVKGCKLISEENIEISDGYNIKQHILERAGEDVTASSAGYDIKHYVLDIDGEDVTASSAGYDIKHYVLDIDGEDVNAFSVIYSNDWKTN